MIVDTSAIMAILLHEPEKNIFTDLIFRATRPTMSTASFVELSAVITRRDPELRPSADTLMRAANITLEPVSIDQAEIASAAYRRFGNGSGHRAGLNFGDCFPYALAITTGEPLLFKGNDFKHTDVLRAFDPA